MRTRIINITIIIFTIIIACFTIIDINDVKQPFEQNEAAMLEHIEQMSLAPHSIMDTTEHEKVFNYLISTLNNYNLTEQDSQILPSYLIQNTRYDTTNNGIVQSFMLKNIIVSIPANSPTKSGDAIIFMSHYDSVPLGPGASDDLVAVAVMLETINLYLEKIANGLTFNNDIIFAFVDGEEFGLYGSKVFVEDFIGFDDIVSRIKFAVNLESRGTEGTLIMFETSKNNYHSVKLFSEVNKSIFTTSIANMVYQTMPNGTDYSNLKDFTQGLNFANLGGGENYHTQNDTYENVGMSYFSQQAQIVNDLIKATMNYDLSTLSTSTNDAIFFSYLNATIIYPNWINIIITIITILMFLALIILTYIYRKQNPKSLGKSFIVIFSAMIIAAISSYILYYILSYIALIFNVIDIHQIGQINYANTTIITAFVIITFVITWLISIILTKRLHITTKEVRKAFTYMITVLSIIISFALKEGSYLFIFMALMLLTNEIIGLFIEDKLLIDVLIFGLCFPIIIPIIFLATFALGSSMAPLFAIIVSMYALTISFKEIGEFKLNCKACKFFLKTTSIFTLILVAFFFRLVFEVTSRDSISSNLTGKQGHNVTYDDAIVLVDYNGSLYYEIADLNAYSIYKKQLSGFTYSESSMSYYKVTTEVFSTDEEADIIAAANTITINKNSISGYISINIPYTDNIDSITITYADSYVKTLSFSEVNDTMISIILVDDALITFNLNDLLDVEVWAEEVIVNCDDLLIMYEYMEIQNIKNMKYNYVKFMKIF